MIVSERENEKEKTMTCLLAVNCRTIRQETYETKSNDARRRASDLRKAGYKVLVSSLGEQISQWGRVKMTMITILNPDDNIPQVNEI
jgi:hypothetical protein